LRQSFCNSLIINRSISSNAIDLGLKAIAANIPSYLIPIQNFTFGRLLESRKVSARIVVIHGTNGVAASKEVAAPSVLCGKRCLPLPWPCVCSSSFHATERSSVLPYVFDQLAMARLPRESFALFLSLLPATATVIGIIVLRQVPSEREIIGVALVIAGIVAHQPPDSQEAKKSL
jgi:threonine/homoserine efflux transporter RhtA